MSIDTFARQMARVAREEVDASLDVEARLQELHVTGARRRWMRAGMAAAAAAVAAAVMTFPGDTPTPSPVAAQSDCPDHALVTCPDESTVAIGGRTPYTLRIPPNFSRDMQVSQAPLSIDVYRDGTDVKAGVTILEGVRAAGRDTEVDAEALARWVRSLGFLRASRVERGKLDGLDAWTVQVEWANSQIPDRAEACNRDPQPCRPVLEQPGRKGWQTGVWGQMVCRYTFVDVPGLGAVAVWSWAFGRDLAVLDGNEALVRSIDFQLPS